jgi:hypothetical protein
VSIISALPGGDFAIGVDARRPAVNSKIILSPRLSNDGNQDFQPFYEGTVRQIRTEDPGLLTGAILQNGFANDPVYEFGTINRAAPLCVGIADQSASSGVPVVLRTCGVSAGTLWVIAGSQPDHDAVFLNGASGSALFALTTVRPARGVIQTAPVTLSPAAQRIIPFSQLWDTSPSS